MQWWNCNLASLRAPLPTAATPAALGTWVRVMAYACEQEGGARLRGASNWSERQWLATANVTPADVDVAAAHGLLKIDGEDVLVWNYPVRKEDEVRAMRAEGAAGGSATTPAKTMAARLNGQRGGRPKRGGYYVKEEPNGTERKPNETQHPKPTAEASPSENSPENPRESKLIGRVSVSGDDPLPLRPFDYVWPKSESAKRKQEKESWLQSFSEDVWLARLLKFWPGVDLIPELRQAKAKRGSFQRAWFEESWLPYCGVSIRASGSGGATKQGDESSEPDRWREIVAGSVYGTGGDREAKSWATLPAEVKAHVRQQLAEEAKARA